MAVVFVSRTRLATPKQHAEANDNKIKTNAMANQTVDSIRAEIWRISLPPKNGLSFRRYTKRIQVPCWRKQARKIEANGTRK